jgi:general secretion pathway protein D
VNGIPVIANRSVTQTVRVKEDETSLISGVLNRQESKAISGLPGFATLPVAGYLFGSHSNTFSDDELLILITPHRLRIPSHQTRSIYAGRGDATTRGGFLGNAPGAPLPQPEPAPLPVEQPETQPPQPPPTPPPQPQPAPEPQPNPQPPTPQPPPPQS